MRKKETQIINYHHPKTDTAENAIRKAWEMAREGGAFVILHYGPNPVNITKETKVSDALLEMFKKSESTVNHPAHYNTGKIEVIDAIEDWQLDFHLGNVVKYVARAGRKGEMIEDLNKARWYLERKIQQLGKGVKP